MLKKFIGWLQKFFPFLGVAALFSALMLFVVFFFNYYDPRSIALAQRINPIYLLIRWDSLHYLDLVLKGYTSPSVLFPLYPLIVAGFSLFFPAIVSGFLVSFLSLAAALYISDRTIVLMLFFPTAMFLPLIYTESLFLLLTVAFFYHLQKRDWLIAAGIGFLATLTRNVGLFLWPIYLLSIFVDLPVSGSRGLIKRAVALIKQKESWYSLAIPSGLLLFCLYSYLEFGDFFAFISGQKGWAQWRSFMWPGATLYHFFKIIFIDPLDQAGLYNFLRIVVFEGGSFLVLVAATIYWFIKKHWPYAMLCLLNALLFSCMYPMISVNRYVVVIFPIFIFLAAVTKKNNWLFYSILALSFFLFIFNIHLFSTGAWVG